MLATLGSMPAGADWAYEFNPETEECVPVDPDAEGFGGTRLTADAEGVDIYYGRAPPGT